MNLHQAIFQLNTNVVQIRGDIAYDIDDNIVEYDLAEAEALVENNEYKVQRAKSYPNIADQLDMLWHAIDTNSLNKTSDFYTTLKAVKDAHPKSGE